MPIYEYECSKCGETLELIHGVTAQPPESHEGCGGRLQRLTRDQTLGEFMVSLGAWTDEQARLASTAETLSSAIGGSGLEPVVGLIDLVPGDSLLLCTDGQFTPVLGRGRRNAARCRRPPCTGSLRPVRMRR